VISEDAVYTVATRAERPHVVPDALVPVAIDWERDEGRYVEPNVWMCHPVAHGDHDALR